MTQNSLLSNYYLCQGGFVFIGVSWFVSLFVSRIMQEKLLSQFSQYSVDTEQSAGAHGTWKKTLDFGGNYNSCQLRADLPADCSICVVRPSTANDLSPRRVLLRGMANVNVSDDRSRRLASEMSWQSPDKYHGIRPCSVLYMNVASLKSTRHRTGNQCSSLRTGVMCSRQPVHVISLAAAFCTDCRRWNRLSVIP